ncbi:NRDE family protein [Draconibacterium sp.]|nr:NRDE family protein [Draconibacterium sp.]
MCTVSYIPGKNNCDFVLTSNRDEKAYRPTLVPQIYDTGNKKLCFPKDAQAGGSWISVNNKGRLCCLLNGAFVKHVKKPHYAQSRGIVLIELASSDKNPEKYFEEKNLTEIEPFTIITVEKWIGEIIHFSEFIWDGKNKHFRQLDPGKPQIWSSVTLYTPEHSQLRKQWFNKFLEERNGSISPENVFEFHSGKHIEDNSINVNMEREGGLKTVSITQVGTINSSLKMKYFDLHNKVKTEIEL